MPELRYDVLVITDPRFPGGTAAAVAEEMRAAAGAGYRVGLLGLEAPNLTYPFPMNPRIRACLDAGLAEGVDAETPVSASLAIVHNPYVMAHPPARPLRVSADRCLLAVQHPPFDAALVPFYDCAAVHRNLEDALRRPACWAPVGPQVRRQLESLPACPPLLGQDWYNVVDAGRWAADRGGPRGDRPRIGRHSRSEACKWPDTREQVLAAYPDDGRIAVELLGGGEALRELVGLYPPNWRVLPFNALDPRDFLRGIDIFVYYHHSRWVEAFGCAIAEAMASGAVCILPPGFAPLFGEAALYAELPDVRRRIERVHADPALYREQSARGIEAVASRFSHSAHLRRLRDLIGKPRAASTPSPPSPRRRRVLFVTSDGVGMGHLTRLLAIARRCPPFIEPVFLTMSQGLRIVTGQGFLAEYIPEHRYLGCTPAPWNASLHRELGEILAFYRPAAVIYDGNCPYRGLVETALDNPDIWFVWCRRGMWLPGSGTEFVRREGAFDMVLEPDDLAGAFDAGPTASSRSLTRPVPPIRLLDAGEMLARDAARRDLGLDPHRTAALLHLGAGNNWDYGGVRRLVLRHLARRGGIQVAVAEWLIADAEAKLPPDVLRLRGFPFARHLNAFDFVVSAVGYNAFHDLLLAGIPTIFVPNEHPQQDDQLGRARFAERQGLGLCVRSNDVYRLGPALDQLLDPDERARIHERCAGLPRRNGAADAAAILAELALLGRCGRARAWKQDPGGQARP